MDRKYPNALAYIKIEAVIRVKQKLWAVKIWAKMIWKQPSSFYGINLVYVYQVGTEFKVSFYTYIHSIHTHAKLQKLPFKHNIKHMQ